MLIGVPHRSNVVGQLGQDSLGVLSSANKQKVWDCLHSWARSLWQDLSGQKRFALFAFFSALVSFILEFMEPRPARAWEHRNRNETFLLTWPKNWPFSPVEKSDLFWSED